MCNPAYAAVGMMGASTVMGAMGAGQQASAGRAQARAQAQGLLFQSQVAKNNAQIAQWQAEDAIEQGQEQEIRLRLQSAGLKGQQRVAYAASGVALDSDSAIRTLVSTEYMTEVDAATIRSNAANAAWGYQNQANSYLDQALAAQYGADSYNAQADSISSGKAVFSSLLSSAAQFGPQLYGMQQAGAFGGSGKFLNAGGGKNITAFDVKSRF